MLPFIGSLPNGSQQPGLGQGKARGAGLHPGPPMWLGGMLAPDPSSAASQNVH